MVVKSVAERFLDKNPAVKVAVMAVMALGVAAVTAVSGDKDKRETAIDLELPADDGAMTDTRSQAFHEANEMLLEGHAELHPMYRELEEITTLLDREELLANMDRIRELATDIHFKLEEQVDEALAHVAGEADERTIEEVLNGSVVRGAEIAANRIEAAIANNDPDALQAALGEMNKAFRRNDAAFDEQITYMR